MFDFEFRETESPYRIVSGTPGEGGYAFEPLGWAEFVAHFIDKGGVQINLRNALISVEEGKEKSVPALGTFSLTSRRSAITEYCSLVEGGWLPAAFSQSEILLPDSNIAGNISAATKAINPGGPVSPGFALSLGAKFLNPIVAATEGNLKRFPSLDEICSRQKQLVEKLSSMFPNQVITPSTDQILAAYEITLEYRRAWPSLREFLKAALPVLVRKGSPTQKIEILDKLRAKAGVKRNSIAYLLCLDCIYAPPNAGGKLSPAREILKPHNGTDDRSLYNVCSDIWILELASKLHALAPGIKGVLCTHDLGIIGFWAKLRPRSFDLAGGLLSAKVSLDTGFAPCMPDDIRTELQLG